MFLGTTWYVPAGSHWSHLNHSNGLVSRHKGHTDSHNRLPHLRSHRCYTHSPPRKILRRDYQSSIDRRSRNSWIAEERLFLPLLISQTLGGLLAGFTLRFVLGPVDPGTRLGSTTLAVGLSPIMGVLLEAIGTFTIATSALIVSTKIKTRRNQAILVGATLFILILLIGPFTGAGFNPARSLGPALASGNPDNLYVYLAGPMMGASTAGLLFRRVRKL